MSIGYSSGNSDIILVIITILSKKLPSLLYTGIEA
jgi:hypothetical protein